MVLSKEAILGAQDWQFEEIEVPEWGGAVRVRGMTGRERDRYELWLAQTQTDKKKTLDNIRAKLVSLTAVDEAGNLLFSEADVVALGQKNALALDRVFQVSRRLCGMGSDQVEEVLGNSEGSTSDDSSLSLPKSSE